MGYADTANLEYACFCPFAVGDYCPLKKEINSYKRKFGDSHRFSPLPPPIYEKFFTAWLLDITFPCQPLSPQQQCFWTWVE